MTLDSWKESFCEYSKHFSTHAAHASDRQRTHHQDILILLFMDTVILGMMSLSQCGCLLHHNTLHEMHHRYRQRLSGSSCFLGIKVCTMALLNVSHPVGHLATDLVMQDSNIN